MPIDKGQHVEEPFITLGQLATGFYFSWFLILVPMIGIIENTLIDLAGEHPNTVIPNRDGPIERRRKSLTANSRLRFEQSTINKDYLFHLYELFKPYCVSAPAERVRTRKDGSKFEGIHTAWYFGTLTLPGFNLFRELFYTAEAYWAMDDGTKHSSGFRLQTDSYSENEVKLL
ncbi:hypothetical protein INT47_004843, partial [Mucor saturninus]